MKLKEKTRKITFSAILCAVSIVLVYFIHFPIFPAASFLEYDPADISILIGTFMLGPGAGIIMTVIVSVIQGLTVSAASGVYGIIMHIIATVTYVFVAGIIYKKNKTIKGAIIGLVLGSIAMALIMIPANLLITPVFMGVPRSAVVDLLQYIVLFNFIKSIINGVVTFVIYKPLKRAFKLN